MDFKSVKMIGFLTRQFLTRQRESWGRRHFLLTSLVFLSLCLPALSFALGLGPITMKSALNQPLLAEIDLHSVQKGDLDGLVVKMASNEDFKRISVEKTGFLSRIDFQVKKHSDGSAFIELTTSRNVTEPYLDFLIEARWPRGRALKEYTVLVDPPVLTAEAPAPVKQAQTSPAFSKRAVPRRRTTTRRSNIAANQRFRPINKPKPAPIPDPEPFEPRAPVREQTQQIVDFEPDFEDRDSGSFNHGVIRRNETLSEIAINMKPSDVSLQQMMLALLRSNPGAFIDGNINKMKAGATLRMDDPTILAELSRSDAYSEVVRQNRQWRAGRTVQQVASNFDDDAGFDDDFGGGSSSSESERSAARLKLVAAGSTGLGTGASEKDGEGNQEIREELLLATEALDANKQESVELTGRLSELEEQLESMQRLINLKDQEMASLQSNLKNQQDVDAARSDMAEPEQANIEQQEQFNDEEATFLSDQTIMALAIFLVVAVVAWMVIRRRKLQDGFEESILNIGGEDDDMMSSQGFGNSFSAQAQSVGSMASAFGMSDMNSTGIETDTSEVDPISEADVYLAYGRHQQAEDILKQAIQTDDSRLDIHAKLMEVYNAASNPQAFESHAQFMFDRVGGDESNEHWQKVVQMGSVLCPENPLFGGSGATAEADPAMVALENEPLDMSFDMPADDTVLTGVSEASVDDELLDFEFDMGDDEVKVADTAVADVDDGSLDFDISSLDFSLDDNVPTGVDNVDADVAANILDDDNSLDFDMGEIDTGTAEADSLDFDGLDLDALSTDSSAPIDLVDSGVDEDLGLDADIFDASGLGDPGLDDLDSDFSDLGSEPMELTLDDDALDLEEVSDLEDGLELSEAVSGFDEATELSGEFDEDIFANVDEIGSKLDLAKAYVDMGDSDGARSILDEVMEEGDDTQKEQAQQLLSQMG